MANRACVGVHALVAPGAVGHVTFERDSWGSVELSLGIRQP